MIRRTYRIWKSPKVKAGGRYRLGLDGAMEVEGIESCSVGQISAADARRAGFDDIDALRRELRRNSKTRITARTRVHCVRFRFVRAADPREALQEDTSAAGLDDVAALLERMDRLSRRGPWTIRLLELIAANPGTVSSRLAPKMKRERRAFKADVRKLKGLGLTVSHGVGYSLSARGEAMLERLQKN